MLIYKDLHCLHIRFTIILTVIFWIPDQIDPRLHLSAAISASKNNLKSSLYINK